MLWTLFVVLLILWTTGVLTGASFGGGLHLLLLAAIAMLFLETVARARSTRD